jgi:hypothetical protein
MQHSCSHLGLFAQLRCQDSSTAIQHTLLTGPPNAVRGILLLKLD